MNHQPGRALQSAHIQSNYNFGYIRLANNPIPGDSQFRLVIYLVPRNGFQSLSSIFPHLVSIVILVQHKKSFKMMYVSIVFSQFHFLAYMTSL